MYKIGQIKVAAPEWDASTAITGNFEANKIYYLKLDSPLSTDIHLYNVRSDGVSPEESTWQLLKPDYADKTIYVFVPLDNYTNIEDYGSGTIYELTNLLPVVAERIGIQARPSSLFVINGELFRVGFNGILEVDNEVKVLSVSRLSGEDSAILDYMYKEDE